MSIFSPEEIYNCLDLKVAGQKEAKEKLATCMFLHQLKVLKHYHNDDLCKTPPILMIGPTGVGKTYLLNSLKEIFGINVIHINANDICQTGWAGMSLQEQIYHRHQSPYDVVHIDEIDKICMSNFTAQGVDYGKIIQGAILTAIEGTEMSINFDNKTVKLDTSTYQFVLSGNFESLRKKRLEKKRSIGFHSKVEEKEKSVTEELIEFGMIGELAGRVSDLVELEQLSREDIRCILTEKDGSVVDKYNELLKEVGIRFILSEETIEEIIEFTLKQPIGMRAINQKFSQVILPHIFKIKDYNTTPKITEDEYICKRGRKKVIKL